MSEKKGWGSTVKGWFIVQDAPEGTTDYEAPSAEDQSLIAQAAAEPPIEVFKSAPPSAPGGTVDFDQVFEAAGITAEERERVTRTLDLLTSLPPGTEETVKRQIVMASLRAFGVPIDQIIETGAEEVQALEAYIRAGAADTEKVAQEAEERIRDFEAQIAQLRTVVQQRVTEQQAVIKNCNTRKLEVQKVLEFFGQEAVARVVRESPKLQEPQPS